MIQAIFDTLVSRAQLREQMSVTTTFDLGWSIQVRLCAASKPRYTFADFRSQETDQSSRDSPRHGDSIPAVRVRSPVPQSKNASDPGSGRTSTGDAIEMLPVGKSAAPYEFSYNRDQAQ